MEEDLMYNDEVWNKKIQQFEKMQKIMYDFLKEIESTCRIYNLSISHEDGHGAFIIEEFKEHNLRWLANADINFK